MFDDLKPYPEYTEPRSPWIPAFPRAWSVAPGAGVLQEVRAKNDGLRETTVLSLSYGRVIVKSNDKLHGLVPASFEGYQILEPGDIVIRPTDLQNDQTSLRVGAVQNHGIVTSAYIGLRPQHIDNWFAFLYLKALDHMKVFYGMGSGLRQNLDFSDFKRLPVPIPTVEEQKAIVTYLAHAHQRINQAIATKRRLIALLEEQKQALTRQAVTAGLGAGTLRDSGFAHIGLIPAHWRVLRAKHLFREFDLRSGTGQETLLSLRQAAGLVHHHEVSPIAIQPEALMNYKVVMPGAVVMNRMRAASGVFAVAREIGLVSPDYSTMSVGEHVVADYYLYLFKTPELMAEFRRRSSGLGTGESGFMRLQYEAFGRIPLPVPPAAEQQAIANLVEERRAIVDAQIDLARREIGALQEFSTCLTAEVVTGQLDVRGVAAALPRIDPAAVFASASVDACEDDGEALEGDALEEA